MRDGSSAWALTRLIPPFPRQNSLRLLAFGCSARGGIAVPPDRSRILQQAQLLASRGQYDAAIAEWKKLAVETPADGTIHNTIGDLQLKRNASGEAASAFLLAASAFRSEGATLKAIAAYKKVLKCDPARYDVYRH